MGHLDDFLDFVNELVAFLVFWCYGFFTINYDCRSDSLICTGFALRLLLD